MATVVSGEWHFAYGNHFDEKVLKTLPPGKRVLGTGRRQSFRPDGRRLGNRRDFRLWSNRHALFRGQEQSQDEREELTTTICFAADADRGFISLPCNASRNADHLGAGLCCQRNHLVAPRRTRTRRGRYSSPKTWLSKEKVRKRVAA